MPSGGVFAASRKHLVLTRARTRENRCNHGDAYNIILIRSGNLSWGLSLLHTCSGEHVKKIINWKLALSRLLALRSQASKEIWASGKRWYSTGINRVDAEIWYLVTVHIEKFGIWELDTQQLKNLEFRNVGIRGYWNQKICAANSSYQRSSHRLVDWSIRRFVDSSIHRISVQRFNDSTIRWSIDAWIRWFIDSWFHWLVSNAQDFKMMLLGKSVSSPPLFQVEEYWLQVISVSLRPTRPGLARPDSASPSESICISIDFWEFSHFFSRESSGPNHLCLFNFGTRSASVGTFGSPPSGVLLVLHPLRWWWSKSYIHVDMKTWLRIYFFTK